LLTQIQIKGLEEIYHHRKQVEGVKRYSGGEMVSGIMRGIGEWDDLYVDGKRSIKTQLLNT